MICVWSVGAGAICPTFSSSVMRESRSATRSLMGRLAFLYLGVLSGGAGLDVLSCAASAMEKSRMRQKRERREISIFLMVGEASPWERIMLSQDTGRW